MAYIVHKAYIGHDARGDEVLYDGVISPFGDLDIAKDFINDYDVVLKKDGCWVKKEIEADYWLKRYSYPDSIRKFYNIDSKDELIIYIEKSPQT